MVREPGVVRPVPVPAPVPAPAPAPVEPVLPPAPARAVPVAPEFPAPDTAGPAPALPGLALPGLAPLPPTMATGLPSGVPPTSAEPVPKPTAARPLPGADPLPFPAPALLAAVLAGAEPGGCIRPGSARGSGSASGSIGGAVRGGRVAGYACRSGGFQRRLRDVAGWHHHFVIHRGWMFAHRQNRQRIAHRRGRLRHQHQRGVGDHIGRLRGRRRGLAARCLEGFRNLAHLRDVGVHAEIRQWCWRRRQVRRRQRLDQRLRRRRFRPHFRRNERARLLSQGLDLFGHRSRGRSGRRRRGSRGNFSWSRRRRWRSARRGGARSRDPARSPYRLRLRSGRLCAVRPLDLRDVV